MSMTPGGNATLGRLTDMASRLASLAGSIDPTEAIQRAEDEVNAEGKMEDVMRDRFDKSMSRGNRWSPARKPTGHKLLWDTGRLRDAAIEAVSGTYRVDHSAIRWSVADVVVDYAGYQNDGTTTIPAREFMARPSEAELAEADELAREGLERWLGDTLREA